MQIINKRVATTILQMKLPLFSCSVTMCWYESSTNGDESWKQKFESIFKLYHQKRTQLQWGVEKLLTLGISSEIKQHLSSMPSSPQGSNKKSMKLARKRLQWWSEFKTETPRESMNSTILCTFSSFRSSSIIVYPPRAPLRRLQITVIFLGPLCKKGH